MKNLQGQLSKYRKKQNKKKLQAQQKKNTCIYITWKEHHCLQRILQLLW